MMDPWSIAGNATVATGGWVTNSANINITPQIWQLWQANRNPPAGPTDDGPRPDLGEDMHEQITPELEKGLRAWNTHPANVGRSLTGAYVMPYGDDALRRAIKRWNDGNGSFLIEQFLRDLKTGHRTIVAVVPPPDEPSEKIPADDPRLMLMWAKIARNAAVRGTSGHYDVLSREVGAPTFKKLEEEEYLRAEHRLSYRMGVDVQVKTPAGLKHPQTAVTGGMIRAALLQILEESSDEQMLERVSLYDSRAEWVLGTGKTAPQAEEAGTDGEHEPGAGGAAGDGGLGGGDVGADGGAGADAGPDPERVERDDRIRERVA